LLTVCAVVFAAVAWRVFPEAQPSIALDQRLTPASAESTARAFANAHGLPVTGTRSAVRFDGDGETQIFLELEGGGKGAVDRELAKPDLALFSWSVRFFTSGDPREVRVELAPDGRVIGFDRVLAEADVRPTLDSVAAQALADSVRDAWVPVPGAVWRVAATSVTTVPTSGRIDRTITYERTDRRVTPTAPLRLDVVIRGDLPGAARPSVKVPEAFTRRYSERRADNELYAAIASALVPVVFVIGLVALGRGSRRRAIRWRPAIIAGTVIGVFLGAASLNEIPGSWFFYDTASPAGSFLAQQWIGAVVVAAGMSVVSAILLAAGELLTREAFPSHYDWWATAADAGTGPVAGRILSGYVVALFGFAYVSVFYLLTTRGLGWWSPSSLVDDPNQIATPVPWVNAVAISLQAGVLEEVMFRAIPIAFVARLSAGSRWARVALGAAILGSALAFGFAHANYPSWPAYARGVELLFEAAVWGVIYVRFGLVTTIVGHFVYDLVLFGLFAAAGTAPEYQRALAVVTLAGLAPAALVAVQWWRQRGREERPRRFADWAATLVPATSSETSEVPTTTTLDVAANSEDAGVSRVSVNARAGSLTLLAVGAVVSVVLGLWRTGTVIAPGFSAERVTVLRTADSLLAAQGERPETWERLVIAEQTSFSSERRFLREHRATLPSGFESRYLHGGDWSVRYVRTGGTVADRTASWEFALLPDGTPHTWEHTIPDSAPAPALPRAQAEALARAAVTGPTEPPLRLVGTIENERPARTDVQFTFEDTTVHLPGGATARRTAVVAGDRVRSIGHVVHLPQAWEREVAARSATRGTVSMVAALLVITALLVGLVRFFRGPRPIGVAAWTRRHTVVVAAVVAAMFLADGVNAWPTAMHAWDTATPFDRHQMMTLLQGLGLVLMALLGAALWASADVVRRRVGVPVTSGDRRRDVLAGIVVAGGFVAVGALPDLIWPSRYSPVLPARDALVPLLDHATDGLMLLFVAVPAVVLAVAAIRGLAARASRQALVLGLLVGLVAVVVSDAAQPTTAQWMSRVAVNVVALSVAVAAMWWAGRTSLLSWVVAGGAVSVLSMGRDLQRVVHPIDAAALGVGIVATVLAVTWVARQSRVAAPPQ
jgi:hypothetical protein